ncbi:MAG: helix-turn-helix domain-containing protein [Lawsonibacter sp.]|jgi:transcriptional regulator with XRE-family HTH domain
MDQYKTGSLIRALRTEQHLTQLQLAQHLGVTDRAVSKWERGLGYPDVSLLPQLALLLHIPVEHLLSGRLDTRTRDGGSMRNLSFFLCPQCGNLITATSQAIVSCCSRHLSPLVPQKPDLDHSLLLEEVEDEWFITSPSHPMQKEHFLTFVSFVSSEQTTLLKRWPEWDFQVRLPRRGHGLLYWHCSQHGLFRQLI